jgi:hypothetical protein
MPAPRVRPFVCATCRRSSAEAAPFWESAFHYPDPVTGAALRLYLCRGCLQNVFFSPDSPFAAIVLAAQSAQTDAESERDLADAAAAELREALEAANQRLAQLEGSGEGEARRMLSQVFEAQDELAAHLVSALEERWGTPPASWRDRAQGVR